MLSRTVLALMLVFAASCGRSTKPLTVGAKTATADAILAEIIAQHLQARTGTPMQVRTGFSSTGIVHQAMLMNEIDLYPETVRSLLATILKEQPDPDANIAYERARTELARLARLELFPTIGLENPYVVVVRADEAGTRKLETASDAAQAEGGWHFASTSDFLGRTDGNTALQTAYSLSLRSAPRPERQEECYRLLREKTVNLVIGSATDGELTSPDFKVLKDDKNAFSASQTCVLTRADVATAHGDFKSVLSELQPRLNTLVMRRMVAQAQTARRQPKDLAADFLAGRIQ